MRDTLDGLIAAQGDGRFVFAHLMTPHPPYVFGPNGGIVECFPDCSYWDLRDLSAERLVDQVDAVNHIILEAVDDLDDDAVVVLFSDHGAGIAGAPDPFGNLVAVRSPGQPHLVPEDVTVVTLLPRLLNAYFGADVPIPDNRHFRGTDQFLELIEED